MHRCALAIVDNITLVKPISSQALSLSLKIKLANSIYFVYKSLAYIYIILYDYL